MEEKRYGGSSVEEVVANSPNERRKNEDGWTETTVVSGGQGTEEVANQNPTEKGNYVSIITNQQIIDVAGDNEIVASEIQSAVSEIMSSKYGISVDNDSLSIFASDLISIEGTNDGVEINDLEVFGDIQCGCGIYCGEIVGSFYVAENGELDVSQAESVIGLTRLYKHEVSFAYDGIDLKGDITITVVNNNATSYGTSSADVFDNMIVDYLSGPCLDLYIIIANIPNSANVYFHSTGIALNGSYIYLFYSTIDSDNNTKTASLRLDSTEVASLPSDVVSML